VATNPGRIRPWRYLATFVGIVAVLYALVLFTGGGGLSPKLGIDLQGGTRVNLQARTVTGVAPQRDQLLQAQTIIQQRVDGLGVSGTEVVLDGSNLTITVPGQEGEEARSLGQTAQLRFREVVGGPVDAAPAAADPNAPPAAADPNAPPASVDPNAPPAQRSAGRC
jgi:preprotein translocase subunit SecD